MEVHRHIQTMSTPAEGESVEAEWRVPGSLYAGHVTQVDHDKGMAKVEFRGLGVGRTEPRNMCAAVTTK